MHELDIAREEILDAVLEDRVGMPPADLHDLPVFVARLTGDARRERIGEVRVAKFIGELHAGGPPLLSR